MITSFNEKKAGVQNVSSHFQEETQIIGVIDWSNQGNRNENNA